MNIKTCSLRIVVNPQGQPTLQFRARRLIAGESGLIDAGWYEWESVPVIDDVEVRATGGRHTCRQIYSGASGCGSTAGESRERPSLTGSPCDGLSTTKAAGVPGCGLWTV
jgi:hypothetical protein